MYMWRASWQPALGKGREAIAWTKELAEYVNKAYSLAAPVQVYREVFGEHSRIYWVFGFKTLADLEQYQAWTRADQGFAALAKKGADAGLVVAGSRRDVLLESV